MGRPGNKGSLRTRLSKNRKGGSGKRSRLEAEAVVPFTVLTFFYRYIYFPQLWFYWLKSGIPASSGGKQHPSVAKGVADT